MSRRYAECNSGYEFDFANQLSFGDITFSEEQRNKNLELYRRVQNWLPVDDVYKLTDCDLLYRFLIGKHWQVNAAEESLRNYVTRRAEQQLNIILLALIAPEIALFDPTIYGFDNLGQPIMWIPLDPLSIVQALKIHGMSAVLLAEERTMEMVRYICKRHEKERCLCVIDLGKVTMTSLNTTTLTFFREFSKLIQENYPEVVHRMLVYNSSWAVTTGWKIVKPFVDKRVQEKIRFFNAPPTRQSLLEFMSVDNVLQEFVEEEPNSLTDKSNKKVKKFLHNGVDSIRTCVKNEREVLNVTRQEQKIYEEEHVNVIEREINEEIARLRAKELTRQLYIGNEQYQREQEQLWLEQNEVRRQQACADVSPSNIQKETKPAESIIVHEITHHLVSPVQPLAYPLVENNFTQMPESVPLHSSESPTDQTHITQFMINNETSFLDNKQQNSSRNTEDNKYINNDQEETHLLKNVTCSNEQSESKLPSLRCSLASSHAATSLRINARANNYYETLSKEEQEKQLEQTKNYWKPEQKENEYYYEQQHKQELECQESESSQEEASRLTTSRLKMESKRISDVSFDSLMTDDRGEKECVVVEAESIMSNKTSIHTLNSVVKESNKVNTGDDIADDDNEAIYSINNSFTLENNNYNSEKNGVEQLETCTAATLVIGIRAVLSGEMQENIHVVNEEVEQERVSLPTHECKPYKHDTPQVKKVSVINVPQFINRTSTTVLKETTHLPCKEDKQELLKETHNIERQMETMKLENVNEGNDVRVQSVMQQFNNYNINTTNLSANCNRCNKEVEECKQKTKVETEENQNEKEQIDSSNLVHENDIINNIQFCEKLSTHENEESEQKEYQELEVYKQRQQLQQHFALHKMSNQESKIDNVNCTKTSHHHCFTRIQLSFHSTGRIGAYCNNYAYASELFESMVCIREPFSTSCNNTKQGTTQVMPKHTTNTETINKTDWEWNDVNEPLNFCRSRSTDLPVSPMCETSSSSSSSSPSSLLLTSLQPQKEINLLSSSSAASVTASESTSSVLEQSKESSNVPYRTKKKKKKKCQNNDTNNLEDDKQSKELNREKNRANCSKEISEQLVHSSPEWLIQPHLRVIGELLKEAGHPIHPCLLICDEKRHVLFILQKSRLRNRLTLYKLLVNGPNNEHERTKTPRALFRKLRRSIRSSSLLSSHSHEHYNLQEQHALEQTHMKESNKEQISIEQEKEEQQQEKCTMKHESLEFTNPIFTPSLRHPLSSSCVSPPNHPRTSSSCSYSSSSSSTSTSETLKQSNTIDTIPASVNVTKNGKYTCHGKRVCAAIIVPHPDNVHDRRSWVMYEHIKTPISLIPTTSISSATTTTIASTIASTSTSQSLAPTIKKGDEKPKKVVVKNNDMSKWPGQMQSVMSRQDNVKERSSSNIQETQSPSNLCNLRDTNYREKEKKNKLVESSIDEKRLSNLPAALMTKLKRKTKKSFIVIVTARRETTLPTATKE